MISISRLVCGGLHVNKKSSQVDYCWLSGHKTSLILVYHRQRDLIKPKGRDFCQKFYNALEEGNWLVPAFMKQVSQSCNSLCISYIWNVLIKYIFWFANSIWNRPAHLVPIYSLICIFLYVLHRFIYIYFYKKNFYINIQNKNDMQNKKYYVLSQHNASKCP